MYYYYLKSKSEIIDDSVYITFFENNPNSNIWNNEPDWYFNDCDRMHDHDIIGVCNLGKWYGKRTNDSYNRILYPNTSYIRSDYRGQGYGILMYEFLLDSIHQLYNDSAFATHDYIDRFVDTTEDARRIYHSFEYRKYLYKKQNDKPKGMIFDIIKFPNKFKFVELETLTVKNKKFKYKFILFEGKKHEK